MNEYIVYSKRCFVEDVFIEAALHIKGKVIYKIYKDWYEVSDNLPVFDYGSLIVMPGIIDAHVHINEPGRTDWEGFDTATKAAAAGGISTLIEMPLNADPVTTTVNAFEEKIKASKDKLHVNCGFYGGIIPTNINDIEGLIKAGVFGIKGFLTHSGIDEFPNVTKADLEAIAPVLQQYNIPLLLHCEVSDTNVPVVTNPQSYQQYVASRPQVWETNAIDLALDIQKRYDIRVHIVHLAAAQGIQRIQQHKKGTDKLTVETCPHYLFFNEETIPDAAPIYKCAPPIRDRYNNEQLWNAVTAGTVDFIASDHSPAPPERKQLAQGDFFTAWGGIAGLQYTLPVMCSLAQTRGIPLEKVIPLLTSQPASFLGLGHRKGKLAVGFDADITVWDDTKKIKIVEENVQHRHKETPYLNYTLEGEVLHTYVNGIQVVKDGKIQVLDSGSVLIR